MKIKQTIRYLFGSSYITYLIYLGAIFAIVHIFVIFAELTNCMGMVGGLEMATVIFLYFLGINIFKTGISMGVQNGISRKTFFLSTIIFAIIFAAITSLGDTLISALGNFYENHITHNFICSSTYQQLYVRAKYAADDISFLDFVKQFFFQASHNILALSIGMLTSHVLKRLNMLMRVLLFASLYLIFFVLIPVLNSFHDSKIRVFRDRFISWISHSSWNFSLLFILISVFCFAILFILIRRYSVEGKNK